MIASVASSGSGQENPTAPARSNVSLGDGVFPLLAEVGTTAGLWIEICAGVQLL